MGDAIQEAYEALSHLESEAHSLGMNDERRHILAGRVREGLASSKNCLEHAGQGEVEKMRELVKVQCSDGNWNFDPYMHGMANGMILGLAMMESNEPVYLTAPDKWLSGTQPPAPAVPDNSAITLLAKLFGAYESGIQCCDESGDYIGQSVRISDEDHAAIVAMLNATSQPRGDN